MTRRAHCAHLCLHGGFIHQYVGKPSIVALIIPPIVDPKCTNQSLSTRHAVLKVLSHGSECPASKGSRQTGNLDQLTKEVGEGTLT